MSKQNEVSAVSETIPTRDELTQQLRERGLHEIVGELATVICEPYESQARALDKQLSAMDVPDGVRAHLTSAVEAIRFAQRQANQPALDQLAHAIVAIAREYHVPVGLQREAENAAEDKPATTQGVPRRRRRIDRDRLREQVKLFARQAGESGLTTTAVARRLQVSKPQAMAICKEMTELNELTHNGKPRQFSRYLDPSAAASV